MTPRADRFSQFTADELRTLACDLARIGSSDEVVLPIHRELTRRRMRAQLLGPMIVNPGPGLVLHPRLYAEAKRAGILQVTGAGHA